MWFLLLVLFPFLLLLVRFLLLSRPYPSRPWLPAETSFVDPRTGEQHSFTAIHVSDSKPNKYVTLVVPAYKEQDRLPKMLDETLAYLKQRAARDARFTWEVLIVDDGSTDNTAAIAMKYVEKEGVDSVRLLKLFRNVGKGGAVRRGMIYGRGQYLLMVDADGATRISDLERLETNLKEVERNGLGVCVGSRAHLERSAAVVQRKWYRNVLMHGFHIAVDLICVRGIRDTQCGFKLFTRRTAAVLFPNLHVERWAFDVELLFLAQRLRIPCTEVDVSWQEIEGSKLDPISASLQIGRDMLRIRFNYLTGWWRMEYPPSLPQR